MHRFSIPMLTIGILSAAAVAAATPITITSGTLIGDSQGANVAIYGDTHGFALFGSGDKVGGIYAPAQQCFFGCAPGAVEPLDAFWSDSDFPGAAVVDGTGFLLSGGNSAGASVDFTGTWTVPASNSTGLASVTAPFLFSGLFHYPAYQGYPDESLSLIGHGTARLALAWDNTTGGWAFQSARYEFDDRPDLTPEPTSWLLLSTGLFGLLLIPRRRARARAR
ncbi:MAG TPA: PEP-CTERM sorting domain-containing protein [Vicinamibacterales bacterium]|nr:PEP-CTERM sorting domain-containing protein [Vicinamibacterales bacterium]